jgi:hypothetical protein
MGWRTKSSDRPTRMDDLAFRRALAGGHRKRMTAATREDQLKPRFRELTWRSPIAAGSGFVASNVYPARSIVHAHAPVAAPPARIQPR